MDALTFLRERTRTSTGRVLFCSMCIMPPVGGLIGHLAGHNPWSFMDIDAVLCAATAEASGASPYSRLHCSGLAPAAYVYAPQVAAWLEPLVTAMGGLGARWAYVSCLFLPALAVMVWYALGRTLKGGDWRARMLAVSGLVPMAFCGGNLGLVMHALVISSLLVNRWRHWLFIPIVMLCVVVKPTFILYLLVPLFEARPWRERLAVVAGSGAMGLVVVIATAIAAGPLFSSWVHALSSVALRDQPGLGWFAFTTWLGLTPNAPFTLLLTFTFVAAMAASGIAIAEAADLKDDERRLLAIGIIPLLTPRLMDYDLLALVPFVALLLRVAPSIGGRIFRYNVSWLLVGTLGFGVIINVLHILHKWPRSQVDIAAYSIVVLACGAKLAAKRWGQTQGRLYRNDREMIGPSSPLHIRKVPGIGVSQGRPAEEM